MSGEGREKESCINLRKGAAAAAAATAAAAAATTTAASTAAVYIRLKTEGSKFRKEECSNHPIPDHFQKILE